MINLKNNCGTFLAYFSVLQINLHEYTQISFGAEYISESERNSRSSIKQTDRHTLGLFYLNRH